MTNYNLEDVEKELLERRAAAKSLHEFVKQAWPWVEGGREFVDGIHIKIICEHLEALYRGEIRNLLVNIPPRFCKSTLVSVMFPAWVWIQNPSLQFLYVSYALNLSMRDSVRCRRVIESPWYQSRWGHIFQLAGDQSTKIRFDNTKLGYRIATSVDGTLTGEGGDFLICDDPNNIRDERSETSFDSAIEWFTQVFSTRMNDPKTGRKVVIQQRAGQNDISGHILANEKEDWVHVCLPFEFEPERKCKTIILPSTNGKVWEDPRTKRGELLWPQRQGPEELRLLKKALRSEYACTPYEAPVLMGDLSLKPIGEVQIGDEVIGWSFNDSPVEKSSAYVRQSLKRVKVVDVFSSIKPVVKVTLDSGEVIRCTPDHKWYVRWRKGRDTAYLPAAIGRGLCRVCPPKLPELSPAEQRVAGWLAGFFDGEGTTSMCGKAAGYRASATISFFQGAGRNKPICERLEDSLRQLGFDFRIYEDPRLDKKNCDMFPYRHYAIRGLGLPTFQKFLHVVQPSKWRQRMMDGALSTKFIRGHEKVVSIEPDGEDTVYSLKTETGNYVVWGLASKNCAGQLQQRPAPAEGGIIKRGWFKLWPAGKPFPSFEYIIQSYDTAFTEKAANDPSACTTWGIFPSEGRWNAMLLDCWEEWLDYPSLRRKAVEDASSLYGDPPHVVDMVLIENKASGPILKTDMALAGLPVKLYNPGMADKVQRTHMISHLIQNGLVYLPESDKEERRGMVRTWVEPFLEQIAMFPNGKHDDMHDTMTQALLVLRDMRLLEGESVPQEEEELSESWDREENRNPYAQ